MAKSAQEKLNEFWNECRETQDSIKEFQDACFARYGSHSYAAGFLESKLVDVIMELPKHKRAELRTLFYQQATKQKKEVDSLAA